MVTSPTTSALWSPLDLASKDGTQELDHILLIFQYLIQELDLWGILKCELAMGLNLTVHKTANSNKTRDGYFLAVMKDDDVKQAQRRQEQKQKKK